MNIIVAVDKNWAIGKDNHLLVSIPKDQKLFRDETLGKVVIMVGRHWKVCRADSRFMAAKPSFWPGIRSFRRKVLLFAIM